MKLFEPNRLGATPAGDRCDFVVWAPAHDRLELKLVEGNRFVGMERRPDGYHTASVPGVRAGERYMYRFGNHERPDPASRSQPEGVHGPSQVAAIEFPWSDQSWMGLPLEDYIFYEMHVGTFTPEGTFEAAISRLDYLASLGVTAIEVMPIAQFPGPRNWGYDGTFPFATQNTYGGLHGFKTFVNACHRAGMAVVLDVVYNHLGPEGNYLGDFGPYFTQAYKTPWGGSLNYDGPDNEGVRRYFTENALFWIQECRVDALRCDAVHAIMDFSADPFLTELCSAVHEVAEASGRRIFMIAESDLNDNRVIRPPALAGNGFDSQWSDDFHHALHVLLTGDRSGYYEDFSGVKDIQKAYVDGYVYSGQYSPHRRRRHGNSSSLFDAKKFVVFAQNHDQVGNRMKGERLCHLVNFERQKLAAAAVLTSPYLPLLFMGEEYAETAPFQYFISHEDPALVEAVRRGRREEFKAFSWSGEPPDPQSEATFNACKLKPELSTTPPHKALFDFYRALIRLRKETPALGHLSRDFMDVGADEAARTLWVHRSFGRSDIFYVFNFGEAPAHVALPVGRWKPLIDSADSQWGGSSPARPDTLVSEGDAALALPPLSFVLFSHLKEI